ncbi:hypothetical protein ACWY4P_45270 [Streptomyces sp. LZ34]
MSYANPIDAFVGHGGCDSDEWINKIVLGPNGTATSTKATRMLSASLSPASARRA